jgi:hypothetical protein
MDLAESGIDQKAFIKCRGAEIFCKYPFRNFHERGPFIASLPKKMNILILKCSLRPLANQLSAPMPPLV